MRTPYKEYKALIKLWAKQMRDNPTPAERELWKHIRKRNVLGLRFLRQHPILFAQQSRVYFFIADFYCHELRMIIEIDGSVHDIPEQREYDRMRTETLEEMGFRVIRYSNRDILSRIDIVLKSIQNHVIRYRQST